MKIEELIKAFELAIPTYQKAVDEKWNKDKIKQESLDDGICYSGVKLTVNKVFKTYYKNYLSWHFTYLFPTYKTTESILLSIKPRLDFMKKEVKEYVIKNMENVNSI